MKTVFFLKNSSRTQSVLRSSGLNVKCSEPIDCGYRGFILNQDEALQRLQKTRRENEEAYLKAKAFMDGFRARVHLRPAHRGR